MSKKLLIVIILLFIFPIFVNAEDLVYNVCKNGCEYSDLQEVFALLHDEHYLDHLSNPSTYDVYINIKDGETYNIDFMQLLKYAKNSNSNPQPSGYVRNISATNFYIKGENSENKPTILSGEGQMAFCFYNASNIVFENLIMKNIVSDGSFHGGDLLIETNNKTSFVKVNNCEVYAADTFYIDAFSIEVKKSIIKTNNAIEIYSRGGTHELTDLDISHEYFFELGNYPPSDSETANPTILKNIVINTTGEYGIGLFANGYSPYILDNVTIESSTKYGIYAGTNLTQTYKGMKYPITIKNSDLSKVPLSIYVQGNNVGNEVDVIFDNSKLNGVKSVGRKAYDENAIGPIISVDSSNTWVGDIIRSNDQESTTATVIEDLDGRVIIEERKDIDLSISDNNYEEVDLANTFENKFGIDFNSITWSIANPEVVEIVNGKLTPKSSGETTIVGRLGDNIYEMTIRVTVQNTENSEVIVNPKTGPTNYIIILVSIIVVSLVLFKVVNKSSKILY